MQLNNLDACLKYALDVLSCCRGVEGITLLTSEEKDRLLKVEEVAEDKIAYGMCKTLNNGLKEALRRDFTAVLLIDSSTYEYPHHPSIFMVYDDNVVGEQIKDLAIREELRKDRKNFFLWDEFVVYTRLLPREKEAKQRLRMVYKPMDVTQLELVHCVEEAVFGTPSTEGDSLLKELMNCEEMHPVIGTCVIGFNYKEV
jgi:hypothetical protein